MDLLADLAKQHLPWCLTPSQRSSMVDGAVYGRKRHLCMLMKIVLNICGHITGVGFLPMFEFKLSWEAERPKL